ncbi:hypothetical protein [Thermococcus celericrescens]|uniref:hypothetical protein n=1 Tax=Thermococcus celericrescens TaxID=227598 RepID=UPI000B32DC64|nr:hypothetical protein [Thermococcus celericrescens]
MKKRWFVLTTYTPAGNIAELTEFDNVLKATDYALENKGVIISEKNIDDIIKLLEEVRA